MPASSETYSSVSRTVSVSHSHNIAFNCISFILPPEVAYVDTVEFFELQRLFVRDYSNLIHQEFERAFNVPQGETVLTWTDRDMILHGMANFPNLKGKGLQLLYAMTKNNGYAWCAAVSSWMADMVTTGCRSHARALMDWPKDNEMLNIVYSRALRAEMISTMYDSMHVFDQLFDTSFVRIDEGMGRVLTEYAMREWRERQLAFAMITHPNLTSKQSLMSLEPCLVKYIFSSMVLMPTGQECDNRFLEWY